MRRKIQIEDLVRDLTIGSGELDLEQEELLRRVEDRMQVSLTPEQKTIALRAFQTCMQEAAQP